MNFISQVEKFKKKVLEAETFRREATPDGALSSLVLCTRRSSVNRRAPRFVGLTARPFDVMWSLVCVGLQTFACNF